jgi:hypothetical protein
MYRNPMLIKQTLMTTAERLQHPFTDRSSLIPSLWLQAPNIFEQGAGKLDLIASHEFLMNARPHLSAHPASLDLTDCPHMFPLCAQPLFWSARPLIANITLLSSLGAASEIVGTPTIVESNTAGRHLQVSFQWSEGMFHANSNSDFLFFFLHLIFIFCCSFMALVRYVGGCFFCLRSISDCVRDSTFDCFWQNSSSNSLKI